MKNKNKYCLIPLKKKMIIMNNCGPKSVDTEMVYIVKNLNFK